VKAAVASGVNAADDCGWSVTAGGWLAGGCLP